MKLWEQILKQHDIVYNDSYNLQDIRLIEGDEEFYKILEEEAPIFMKYEHLYYIVLYMTDTHDDYERPYAYELIRDHLYNKWHLYYERYLEDDPYQIDILIECAIDNNIQSEYTAFLINKKYELNAFKQKDWRL